MLISILFLAALLCYHQDMTHAEPLDIIVDPSPEPGCDDIIALKEENALLRHLYQDALVRIRVLEKGLLTTQRERLDEEQKQLTLDILDSLFSEDAPQEGEEGDDEGESEKQGTIHVPAHERKTRRSRKLPEHLSTCEQMLIPEEVLERGLANYDIIGEERSETLEQRPSRLFKVVTVRPKFVLKDRDRDRSEEARRARELAGESYTEVLIAEPSPHPIPKSIAGPGLLADTVVARYQDHLPLNRLQKVYKREGVEVYRSTICQWHTQLAELVAPLVSAMWEDAREQPILYTDATGVRVRAKKKCRNAHFWAVIAPHRHILFAFTKNHKKQAVDKVIGDFSGYLVADAHTVYDHLYIDNAVTEVGCWAHARRYLHKTLDSQPDEAMVGLAIVNQFFRLERLWKALEPKPRKKLREAQSRPLVERFFAWCDTELPKSIEGTPLYAALRYACNQREALMRFLDDGRLPIHNNATEGALRRQAIGRKNWLFLGNNDAGHTNSRFVSLLASCQLHDIEPRRYLLDVFCLLPIWPKHRILELSPLHWTHTRARQDVQQALAENSHWRAATDEFSRPP